jgi:hypothetical protein
MAAFDDYEFVSGRTRFKVNASDLPGSLPIQEDDIRELSLNDVLDRHERADLVAVIVHDLQASVPGTASAECPIEAGWELHAGVGSSMILGDDAETTTGAGESGVVDYGAAESDSPDVLAFARWVAEGGFNDSGNTAAGPDQPVINHDINYPRDYGSCPTFDDRDTVTESIYLGNVGSADVSDSLILLISAYTLVFAVHERDS